MRFAILLCCLGGACAHTARTTVLAAAPIRGTGKQPTVRGALGADQIAEVVRRHVGEVRACAERRLGPHSEPVGRISIAFEIGPSGAVRSATVESTTVGDEDLERCMVAAIMRWVFPPPEGGATVTVTYPFNFGPS